MGEDPKKRSVGVQRKVASEPFNSIACERLINSSSCTVVVGVPCPTFLEVGLGNTV